MQFTDAMAAPMLHQSRMDILYSCTPEQLLIMSSQCPHVTIGPDSKVASRSSLDRRSSSLTSEVYVLIPVGEWDILMP